MDVLVLDDTHLRGGIDRLPPPVLDALGTADLVLHAGDVVAARAYRELAEAAAVRAVLGNNDHELVGCLPATLELELDGVRVAMVHDAGPAAGRAGRLFRRFPAADLVVFGHSHAPCDEPGLDGQRLFNPGSPTQRRRQPRPSLGRLEIGAGRLRTSVELL
ncbi:MAG: metallophosphoesterase family protein [Acidimicrobiales bacterium]